MNITVNVSQSLFVIPCHGGGFSTAGFEYIFRQLKKLAMGLQQFGIDVGAVTEDDIGTLRQYKQYEDAIGKIGNRDLGTWYDLDTPTMVRWFLEEYRQSKKQIRIFYGDRETGRSWLSEMDVIGRVGRSTGKLKIPLLIPPRQDGGPGILDRHIVRLMDVRSKNELYRHDNFYVPEMEIKRCYVGKPNTHSVWSEGMKLAGFPSLEKAKHWIAFMNGESMAQPR